MYAKEFDNPFTQSLEASAGKLENYFYYWLNLLANNEEVSYVQTALGGAA